VENTRPTVGDAVEALDRRFPPRLAAGWDRVGLVCGDPAAPVRRVMFAVDPVMAVVDEAVEWGADLLVVHHPLMLRGVHSVAATTPKGAVVHRLVTSGVALYAAHTNADAATGGVADALAAALGLVDVAPLRADPGPGLDKHVVFVPVADASAVVDAMAAEGAGAIGEYSRCAWSTTGEGTFVPSHAANPTVGTAGQATTVVEARVEMVAPRGARAAVVAAMRAAHPYEEPAFDVLELAAWPESTGLGRLGRLPATCTLHGLASTVAAALPPTVSGVRYAGPPEAPVARVAVLGGAGDSELDTARASGADVYVTADLRHHPASEAREQAEHEAATGRRPAPTPYLIDVSHAASEWLWLPDAARALTTDLDGSVETRVSTLRTDPWTGHVPARTGGDS